MLGGPLHSGDGRCTSPAALVLAQRDTSQDTAWETYSRCRQEWGGEHFHNAQRPRHDHIGRVPSLSRHEHLWKERSRACPLGLAHPEKRAAHAMFAGSASLANTSTQWQHADKHVHARFCLALEWRPVPLYRHPRFPARRFLVRRKMRENRITDYAQTGYEQRFVLCGNDYQRWHCTCCFLRTHQRCASLGLSGSLPIRMRWA